YDLVVVGMGSGGTIAAEFAARDLDLRVAAVEHGQVGGDRLWTGSVPSKALLASAKVAHVVRDAARHGVVVGDPELDLAAMWERIRSVQNGIANSDDDPERFRSLGIDLIEGTARITGARQVTVETPDGERVLDTTYVLVCTGSRPSSPLIPGLDSIDHLTNETLFELERPPSSLALIGGGPIAAELSQALVRLGVRTTIFELGPRLLPRDEPELTERVTQILRDEGVEIHLGSAVTEVTPGVDGVDVRTRDTTVEADAVLVAAGRTSNVQDLGLERFGIGAGPDGIVVDGRSRTIVPSIYAVGDAAADRTRFTHSAAHDAAMAVRDMFLPGRGLAAGLVPWCTFTDPELAHVGLTAAQARGKYGDRTVEVHRRELADNHRARADGRTDGAIIIVTAKRRIVGAHVLAPAAGELIHELALAVRFGLRLADISDLVHVYPTYATSVQEAATERSFRTRRRFRALARLSRWLG
ncbi:MAG: NAD(P)/FAD-dependent oxidoreductase, partial [Ilumatobacteraceae bacterium]